MSGILKSETETRAVLGVDWLQLKTKTNYYFKRTKQDVSSITRESEVSYVLRKNYY